MLPTKPAILYEPLFTAPDNTRHNPKAKEVFREWLVAINVVKSPSHFLTAGNFASQLIIFVPFVSFVSSYLAIGTTFFFIISSGLLGTVYNTVWYHRYCSHLSFTFTKPIYACAFLWSNPLSLIFREEVYAIPHRRHHQRTERSGDPYGPHLGWLGSFLAPEITQRINKNLSEKDFNSLKASVTYIGLRFASFPRFRISGSLEDFPAYYARVLCGQLFWAAPVFLLGGIPYLTAWYAAIFVITCLIRDFNWRGHGGSFPRSKKKGWEFDDRSYALNQKFYGYLASEWHDNHHKYPFSANNGFLPGQIDIAFKIIKLMHWLDIVESYVDARPIFENECLSFKTGM